jgi:hypothetical protein
MRAVKRLHSFDADARTWAGCATQEVKVSCDGKLQPINPPRRPPGWLN